MDTPENTTQELIAEKEREYISSIETEIENDKYDIGFIRAACRIATIIILLLFVFSYCFSAPVKTHHASQHLMVLQKDKVQDALKCFLKNLQDRTFLNDIELTKEEIATVEDFYKNRNYSLAWSFDTNSESLIKKVSQIAVNKDNALLSQSIIELQNELYAVKNFDLQNLIEYDLVLTYYYFQLVNKSNVGQNSSSEDTIYRIKRRLFV